MLAFPENIMYTNNCCGMIAVKREVAAVWAGFPSLLADDGYGLDALGYIRL